MTQPKVTNGAAPMVSVSAELLYQLSLVVMRESLLHDAQQYPGVVEHLGELFNRVDAVLAEHAGTWLDNPPRPGLRV